MLRKRPFALGRARDAELQSSRSAGELACLVHSAAPRESDRETTARPPRVAATRCPSTHVRMVIARVMTKALWAA